MRNFTKQIIAGSLCLVTGILILLKVDLIPRWQSGKALRSWAKTEAILTKYATEKPDEGSAYSIIEYKYLYGGNEYISGRYSFGYLKPLLSSRKYIPGMKLVCYVNPENPSQAIITVHVELFKAAIGFSLFFIITGLFIFALIIYQYRMSKSQRLDKKFRYLNYDDPVANKTEWSSLPSKIGRGGNFQVYKLRKDGNSRYCYSPTFRFFLFCVITLLSGIYLIMSNLKERDIIPLSVGFIILILVFCVLFTFKKFVFDNQEKAFWYTTFVGNGRCSYTYFKDIHALQIIYVPDLGSDGVGFSNYQINLVLTNGKRIYLISQPTLGKAQENAQLLSNFIGCLVWTKPY